MGERAFADIMAQWATFDETTLARRWEWRGRPLNVREALYRTLEAADEVVVRARAAGRAEAIVSMSLAQRALGDLCGLLCGLPDRVLDAVPSPGEWPVRDIVRHIVVTERRYAAQTAYAWTRPDSAPLRIDTETLAQAEQVSVSGGAGDLVRALEAARRDSNERLATLPGSALDRPTQWAGYDVTVRFRLHRFPVHVIEHTIHCEKALVALGVAASEGRRIVRRIWAARGEAEILATPAELSAFDKEVRERAATL